MTNDELQKLFSHHVFQGRKFWAKQLIRQAVWDKGDELIFGLFDYISDGEINNVTFIPTIEQLQEMSGLDWIEFCGECIDLGSVYDYDTLIFREKRWLLTGAMVVMAEKGFKWNGKDWVKD